MDVENKKESCLQKDSAEHEGYVRAHRSFNRIWKERDSAQPELLEKILDKDNLNRAFKRVKANKGAHTYFRENQKEFVNRISDCLTIKMNVIIKIQHIVLEELYYGIYCWTRQKSNKNDNYFFGFSD